MAAVYDGLTRNSWTGTWSPSGDHPIVLSNEIRGGIQYVSGDSGDQLTDIPGQRLVEGMLVYVKNTYGSVTGDKYYTYSLLSGESRNASTGEVPNAAGNWSEAALGGGSISVLSDIGNVSTTAPNTGQVLKWDGSQWAPAADSGSGAGISLTDISVGTPATASGSGSLAYNSTTGVFTFTPPEIPAALTDLGITDGTNGQVLTTDGSGNFTFANASGGATSLSGLSDVSTSSPTAGQVLKWSGTEWAPATDSTASSGSGIALTDLSVSTATNFGAGNLTYNTSTGVFLFTPPDLSSYSTFSGNYSDLQGLPTLFSGDYSDLTNTPATSDNLELCLL